MKTNRKKLPSFTPTVAALLTAVGLTGAFGCDRGEEQSSTEREPVNPPGDPVAAQEARLQDPAANPPRPEEQGDFREPGATTGSVQRVRQGTTGSGAEEVTDAKLQRFAGAYVKVQALNDEYSPRISGASDSDEARAIRQQAAQRVARVVQDQDLSVAEYSKLAERINGDAALRQRLQKQLEN